MSLPSHPVRIESLPPELVQFFEDPNFPTHLAAFFCGSIDAEEVAKLTPKDPNTPSYKNPAMRLVVDALREAIQYSKPVTGIIPTSRFRPSDFMN